MILLQLSAAKGPSECALAVAKAFELMQSEAQSLNVEVDLLECLEGYEKDTLMSVLCALDGDNAKALAEHWSGSFLWRCQSPFRPTHKRKNWFFGGHVFEVSENSSSGEIEFQFCRASGAGGQHVNKTDSAVRAVHKQSGISVRVESQRSQHANKRLAVMLIHKKLEEQAAQQLAQNESVRRLHHYQIERGNVKRSFKGLSFKPCD